MSQKLCPAPCANCLALEDRLVRLEKAMESVVSKTQGETRANRIVRSTKRMKKNGAQRAGRRAHRALSILDLIRAILQWGTRPDLCVWMRTDKTWCHVANTLLKVVAPPLLQIPSAPGPWPNGFTLVWDMPIPPIHKALLEVQFMANAELETANGGLKTANAELETAMALTLCHVRCSHNRQQCMEFNVVPDYGPPLALRLACLSAASRHVVVVRTLSHRHPKLPRLCKCHVTLGRMAINGATLDFTTGICWFKPTPFGVKLNLGTARYLPFPAAERDFWGLLTQSLVENK